MDINKIGRISIPQGYLVDNLDFYHKVFKYLESIPVKVDFMPGGVNGSDVVFTLLSPHFRVLEPGMEPPEYTILVMRPEGMADDDPITEEIAENPEFVAVHPSELVNFNIIPLNEFMERPATEVN